MQRREQQECGAKGWYTIEKPTQRMLRLCLIQRCTVYRSERERERETWQISAGHKKIAVFFLWRQAEIFVPNFLCRVVATSPFSSHTLFNCLPFFFFFPTHCLTSISCFMSLSPDLASLYVCSHQRSCVATLQTPMSGVSSGNGRKKNSVLNIFFFSFAV